MTLISILGSCRQIDPLESYTRLPLSSIHELTYPHYTKEILQAVRYLKDRDSTMIDTETTRWCFRNGILHETTISDEQYNRWQEEFNETSLFLIEIASRRAYNVNGVYVHHIAIEEKYGLECCREQVHEYDLSNDDIETDILALRQELHPRPLVIFSHLCTYKNGKRYELTCLLKDLCVKHDISFFNPTALYDNFGSRRLLHEPLIAHYSPEGERLITQVYLYIINSILKTTYKPTFIHNFQVKEEIFFFIRCHLKLFDDLINK